jgi:hypothetical protein
MPLENHLVSIAAAGFCWNSQWREPTGAERHWPKQQCDMQAALLDSSLYKQSSEMGFQTWICISSARI